MTPTEQDKELREAIVLRLQHAYYNRHTDGIAGVYAHALSILNNYTDEIMALITSDRKRVALEASISELNKIALDNYRGKTVSESTNWQAKFEYFMDSNERRIALINNKRKELL